MKKKSVFKYSKKEIFEELSFDIAYGIQMIIKSNDACKIMFKRVIMWLKLLDNPLQNEQFGNDNGWSFYQKVLSELKLELPVLGEFQ